VGKRRRDGVIGKFAAEERR